MIAAFVSLGVMAYVLFTYGLKDDSPPPTSKKSEQVHGGAQHFTAEKPEHEGGKPSPLQVYETAKVGEWRAYRVITESHGSLPAAAALAVGDRAVAAGSSIEQTFHAIGIETITKVDDKTVSRAFSGRVEETGQVQKRPYEDRPRQGLTIDQLTGNDVGGWTIYELAITDEDHAIGGRTFKCKKLSYASNDPMFPSKRTHTDLWISAEVLGGGIVEEREVQEMPEARFAITQQLIGFGPDDKTTTWGEKPAL